MLRLAFILFTTFELLSSTGNAVPRVALVIGNSAYQHTAPLKNPGSDALDIAGALQKLGFDVLLRTDADHRTFRDVIAEFDRRLEGAELGLLYYAGHGVQVDGKNYLLPIDAELKSELDLSFEAIPLELLQQTIEGRTKTSVLFLDACQNNPLAQTLAQNLGTRSAAVVRGLARIDTGLGTFVAFATLPGQVALDGSGRNSPFTAAVLNHIATPGLDVSALLQIVRREVVDATDGQQVPWDNSTLLGPIVLNGAGAIGSQDENAAAASLEIAALPMISSDPAVVEPLPDQADQAPISADLPDLAKRAQTALNRLGCDPGVADGVWGARSGQALRRFYEHAGLNPASQEPTQDIVDLLESRQGRVCTVSVKAEAPAAEPPPPMGSNCFMFNNRQVCQ